MIILESRRDQNISDFVLTNLYKSKKLTVRQLVEIAYAEWPSEIIRKREYYSSKGISKTENQIEDQVRVDLARVMLEKTTANPNGRKDLIERDGSYYFLNDKGILYVESLLKADDKIKPFKDFINTEKSEDEELEDSDKIKIFAKNPFRQSICVLGDPGAGKSTTVRKILRNEGYRFQIWEPSAATTGLLAQFTPLKGYIPSRVGSMMIAASKDPENLYTFVIEEAHKSSIIEMINDELKHAISLRRFEGDRFVPYEDSTSYLAEYLEEDDGGNLKVPDNFGFIFISSKPKVIANNGDIFDRLDIILLKHYEEEKIQSVSELLSKVLGPEEKIKLKATRND